SARLGPLDHCRAMTEKCRELSGAFARRTGSDGNKVVGLSHARVRVHFIVATLRQKFFRLSVTPNSVVKCVESTRTMSPARCFSGGIHRRQLSSLFPAVVNGCGRSASIGWHARRCIALLSFSVIS